MTGPAAAARRDAGAAVVEFALVAVLLTTLFAAVLQLGLALYVRTTLVAAAADGARYAARADRTPAEGAAYTRAVIGRALSPAYARDVRPGYAEVDGLPVVAVEVRARLPVVGLLGPERALVVRGHALREGR